MQQKIPKKLHYVWVGGGKMSDLMVSCMASWKKFCPDYEIIEWNEKNFDIEGNPLIKTALAQRNWSLVSDIMRAWILFQHGGIYLDTDVEILKPLDHLLTSDFFMGYESKHWVNTAIIGSVKGHPIIEKAKEWYMRRDNSVVNQGTNLLAVQVYSTLMQQMYGIKPNGKTTAYDSGISLYAKDYFYGQHYLTHKIKLTKNSNAIHRCSSTWHSKKQRRQLRFYKAAHFVLRDGIFSFFEGIAARRYRKTLKKEFETLKLL